METDSLHRKRKSWIPQDSQLSDREDAVFYSCIKQSGKTADFLNLKLKNGRQKALAVSSISELEYLPDEGMILLYYGFAEVTITGKHLEVLYQKLVGMKVIEIREYADAEVTVDYNQLVVSGIRVVSNLENSQYH